MTALTIQIADDLLDDLTDAAARRGQSLDLFTAAIIEAGLDRIDALSGGGDSGEWQDGDF